MAKIQQYNGYKAEKITSNEPLPEGAYCATILKADLATSDYGDQLVISFDIAIGDYKGFFQKQFAENTRDDKKWKGVVRLRIPNEQHDYFATEKKAFNNFTYAVEQSNNGYTWDWDTDSLKGKNIGVQFRQKEWEMTNDNGEYLTGWTTECGAILPTADVLSGNFKPLKPKALKKKAAEQEKAEETVPVGEEDLPF